MSSDLPTTALSHLYNEDRSSENVEAVFQYAKSQFEVQGAKDPKKKARLQVLQATTANDLLSAVQDAQKYYHQRQSESAIGRRIEQFSERVHHYGKIMDVLVSHHPEYVSLAWGAMKLLFGAVVEHKNIGLAITNGLIDVADALSCAELAASLYPTASIIQTFANLYAHIIRFLLRALEWYEEGSLKRFIHSVTRPVPLRYSDIINDINRTAASIAAHATTSSQAEQRDIHHEVFATRKLIEANQTSSSTGEAKVLPKLQDLYDLVAIMHAEQHEISRSVFRIQSTQALQVISAQCLIDHQADLQMSIHLRNSRRFAQRKTVSFWKSPWLHSWNQSSSSALLPLKVPCTDRQVAQDFCINIIEQLLGAKIANIWVLTPRQDPNPVIATLKSLIYQAATFIDENGAKNDILNLLDQFNHARLESHYLDVLAGLLRSFKVVYLIVQLEAIDPQYADQFFYCLEGLIDRIPDCGTETVIRILILSWSPRSALNKKPQTQNLYLQRRGRSRRRGVQVPRRPLFMNRSGT